eukprot:1148458-Pelagomonas_calceolata.AAC.3
MIPSYLHCICTTGGPPTGRRAQSAAQRPSQRCCHCTYGAGMGAGAAAGGAGGACSACKC